MIESDNDIEFLDEDADIVQQCVQVQNPILKQVPFVHADNPELVPVKEEIVTPLLVERQRVERKKKRKIIKDDDSDYDPEDDPDPPSPPSPTQRVRKKKQQFVVKKVNIHDKEIPDVIVSQLPKMSANLLERKKITINIPDYDDPLCLPVKAIRQEKSDVKRLNNWNNVCLEHFKHCDNLLKPEKGETNSSTRTVIFRNVLNKQSGKTETTIWSKTCVENIDGDKKSEIFQCVLPRYEEKKTLPAFTLGVRKSKPYHVTDEVVLAKEDHKDSEVLVIYKPKENLSTVYQLIRPSSNECLDESSDDKEEDDVKMYMKELLCCKMCVPCYQMSWRGVNNKDKKPISCPICRRSTFVTAYNLLSHFKTHSSQEIRKYKSIISKMLADIVDYHYKCRTCGLRFDSIKKLRYHLGTHQGNEMFKCEVGNHMTK